MTTPYHRIWYQRQDETTFLSANTSDLRDKIHELPVRNVRHLHPHSETLELHLDTPSPHLLRSGRRPSPEVV